MLVTDRDPAAFSLIAHNKRDAIIMGTGIKATVKRGEASRELDVEQLTDDELHDLLKRSTPTQVRAYAFLLATWIRDSAERQTEESTVKRSNERIRKKR
jgi:hypothetical protein